MANELKMLELTGENRSRYWTLRIRQYHAQRAMEAFDGIAPPRTDFYTPILGSAPPRSRKVGSKAVREASPRRETLTVNDLLTAIGG